MFLKKKNPISTKNNSDFLLKIGKNDKDEIISLPEKSLYQNFLITGSIGTGKTSSAMYPFTKQLINLFSNDVKNKIGFLILDVKGNYFKKVEDFAKKSGRENDLIVIELNRKV